MLSLVFPLDLLLLPGQSGLAHLLQGLARVHDEGQSHAGRAVAALPWEAQEGGPEEGAAAHEGRSHVERHQDKVQKLWRGSGMRGQNTGWELKSTNEAWRVIPEHLSTRLVNTINLIRFDLDFLINLTLWLVSEDSFTLWSSSGLILLKFFQLTDINVHKTINSFHVYLHEWPVHESSLKEKTGCDELLGDTNNLIMSFDWMLWAWDPFLSKNTKLKVVELRHFPSDWVV